MPSWQPRAHCIVIQSPSISQTLPSGNPAAWKWPSPLVVTTRHLLSPTMPLRTRDTETSPRMQWRSISPAQSAQSSSGGRRAKHAWIIERAPCLEAMPGNALRKLPSSANRLRPSDIDMPLAAPISTVSESLIIPAAVSHASPNSSLMDPGLMLSY